MSHYRLGSRLWDLYTEGLLGNTLTSNTGEGRGKQNLAEGKVEMGSSYRSHFSQSYDMSSLMSSSGGGMALQILFHLRQRSWFFTLFIHSMSVGCLHRGRVTLDKVTSLKWRTISEERFSYRLAVAGQPSHHLGNKPSVLKGHLGGITQQPRYSIPCAPFASYRELILGEMTLPDWTGLFS